MKNILIVDDDPVICALLRSYLSLKKYKVETVSTLDAALNVIAKEPFDVVITDLKIHGVFGTKLLKRIFDIRPNIKMIAMSGDTSSEKLTTDFKGDIPFLHKPFKLQEVERLIIELCSQDS